MTQQSHVQSMYYIRYIPKMLRSFMRGFSPLMSVFGDSKIFKTCVLYKKLRGFVQVTSFFNLVKTELVSNTTLQVQNCKHHGEITLSCPVTKMVSDEEKNCVFYNLLCLISNVSRATFQLFLTEDLNYRTCALKTCYFDYLIVNLALYSTNCAIDMPLCRTLYCGNFIYVLNKFYTMDLIP